MKVELRWTQTWQVATFNKSLTLWPKVILWEMRESSMVESEWDASAFYILLSNTCHNLGYVDVATFWACLDHISQSVLLTQSIKSNITRLVSRIVELLVDLSLKTLLHWLAWLTLKLAYLAQIDNRLDLSFELLQGVCDTIWSTLFIDNYVLYTNSESIDEKPIVHKFLHLRQEFRASLMTILTSDHVHKALACVSNHLFSQESLENFTFDNQDI